ncbi:MAG TPA: peroxiredoxin [Longimicrobiales bacterium]
MPENVEPRLLGIGAEAPDFTLVASDGTPVTLSEFRGRSNVCLFFYPQDETAGCTRQLGAARDDRERFIAKDVERFGVNPGSLESHRRFVEKAGLDFPLLVDADLEVARSYGAARPGDRRVWRTVYLIDKAGEVAFAARGCPTTDEILGALDR